MDLIINGVGSLRTSLGARRYYEGVIKRLDWPGKVEVTALPPFRSLERVSELLQRGRRGAIFWSPSHRGPLSAHHHVITVLDCLNVEYKYRTDWRLPIFRRLFNTVLRNAQAVVAISHATRDAVLRNYEIDPGKVVVIPGPIDFSSGLDAFSGSVQLESPRSAEVTSERPFVLMITNDLPHKNTAEAGSAFAASSAAKRGVVLRVVGSFAEPGLQACRAAGVQVEVHKRVEDAILVRWLRQCTFLFAASLDEGLDLPVGEALSHRANVLCSDIPVHREFYEGQVVWFDPRTREGMVTALNAAFDRDGQWSMPGPARPLPTFADVACDYRSLFLGITEESR
jgi:glycosyltransferase involved in cell wall biosynthesis